MRRLCATLAMLMIFAIAADCRAAGVVVNEVLANEPGSSRRLEWLELYNDSTVSIGLASFLLEVGTVVIELPDIRIRPGEHYIVCQSLYGTPTSPGFEGYWGDSSGVWGDAPSESALQTPYEARSLSLVNTGGSVILADEAFNPISILGWNREGQDGFSWERLHPNSDSVHQCVDVDGSTPGFINSLAPVPIDLAVASVGTSFRDGQTTISAKIANRGLSTVTDAVAHFLYPPTTPQGVPDTIGVAPIPGVQPDQVVQIQQEYTLPGVYVEVIVDVSTDDRNRNNQLQLTVPGNQYPPFYITEFLANPDSALGTEWIELRNRLDIPYDISRWRIGDAQNSFVISEFELILAPGEYFILADDIAAFLDFYRGFSRPRIEPSSWPLLNNSGDEIILTDHLGIQADYFLYTRSYPDNFTWCRGEESPNIDRWGRSSVPNGSPGGANDIIFETTVAPITLTADPPVFAARSGSGPDSTALTVTAPSDESYTLKIYDRQGRVVRTFADESPVFYDTYIWRGGGDDGTLLPIGMYIALYEVGGVGIAKQAVVIAR